MKDLKTPNQIDHYNETEDKLMKYARLIYVEGYTLTEIAKREGVTKAVISLFMKKVPDYPRVQAYIKRTVKNKQTKKVKKLCETAHQGYINNLEVYQDCYLLYEYMVNNQASLKKVAMHFQVSIDTISKDLQSLFEVSPTCKQTLSPLLYARKQASLEASEVRETKYLRHIGYFSELFLSTKEVARLTRVPYQQLRNEIICCLKSPKIELQEAGQAAATVISNHDPSFQKRMMKSK